MPSVINTNIASLNAQRNLGVSQSALATSLQRLSSGLRINSAKDDAAGMAIADRMSSQIRGLNQAARNANDGVSLSQTAEGGLSTATDLLQRLRELAVQSANSTNSAADRASLQSEAAQIKDEIDRVAKTTNFNGINLLDGSFTAQTFQVGANSTSGDRIQITAIANMQTSSLGTGVVGSSSVTGAGMVTTALTSGDLTLNGIQVGSSNAGSGAGQTASSAWSIAQAINLVGGLSGVTATATAAVATEMTVTGLAATAAVDIDANAFTVNGVGVGKIFAGTIYDSTTVPPTAGGLSAVIDQGAKVAEAINKVTDQTGVRASVDEAGLVTLTSLTGKNIDLRATNSNGTFDAAALLADTGLTFAESSDAADVGIQVTLTGPTAGAYTADSMRINGVSVGAVADGGTVQGEGANVAAAINLVENRTGVHAMADSLTGALTLTAADGRNIFLQDGVAGDGTVVLLTGIDVTANPINATAGDGIYSGTVTLQSSNVNGIAIGGLNDAYAGLQAYEGQVAADTSISSALSSVDISTANGAVAALATIDKALAQVDSARGAMGALQNRFEGVVSNLAVTSNNLSSARSRIQDTDFAAETAALTRNQILQQAGTAMLAQANQLPQLVLSLLK